MTELDRAPDGIERRLTLDILRGIYAPGSRLPTVRDLARAFAVNPSTIQRVVARLETRGLVTARQGSGLRVNDPRETGDLSLTPLWLASRLHAPEQAARLLEEFLEVRRVLAAHLLVRHRAPLLARAAELATAAAAVESARGAGIEAFAEADLALARLLLGAAGNTLALVVLNTAARVLDEVPAVREAMYADPARNAASMRILLGALAREEKEARVAIEGALAEVDRHTVLRFEAILRTRMEVRA